jgi:hypothetical protein
MPNLDDCSPNAAFAYDFLVRRGLSSAQAAGVIGNLQWESRLDPHNDAPDPRKDDPSARGRGIAAWGPPRWQDLLTFTYARGFDPKSLEGQLEFLWHELEDQPSLGLRELAAKTSIEDAVITFQNRFERCDPARCRTDRRIALAYTALACLSIRPPSARNPVGVVAASLGVFGLVAAAAYGTYKALDWSAS